MNTQQNKILNKIENLIINIKKYTYLQFYFFPVIMNDPTFSNEQREIKKEKDIHNIKKEEKIIIEKNKASEEHSEEKVINEVEDAKIKLITYYTKIVNANEAKIKAKEEAKIKRANEEKEAEAKQVAAEEAQAAAEKAKTKIIIFKKRILEFYVNILDYLLYLTFIKQDIVLTKYKYLLDYLYFVESYVNFCLMRTEVLQEQRLLTVQSTVEQKYNIYLNKIDNIIIQISESELVKKAISLKETTYKTSIFNFKYMLFFIIIPLLLLAFLKHINFFDNFSGGKNTYIKETNFKNTYINEKNNYKKLKKYYYN